MANKPDVDLTDGVFYAGDSRSVYKWMRENEPVFRDRNGLAAAATYQAVIEAEWQVGSGRTCAHCEDLANFSQ